MQFAAPPVRLPDVRRLPVQSRGARQLAWLYGGRVQGSQAAQQVQQLLAPQLAQLPLTEASS